MNKKTKNNKQSFTFAPSNHKRVSLPLPPEQGEETRFEMDVYARFMRHLRSVPNSRMEIKILASIQFAADMMDTSDALVAKTLVDLGLNAPRKAFPISFLDFVDKSMMRASWDSGSPQVNIVKLHDYWNRTGEDHFSHVLPVYYAIYNSTSQVTV